MRQRRPLVSASTLAPYVAVGSLVLLFLWLYGRFAGRLYLLLDDYIEMEAVLARPLLTAIADSFRGVINWSGYRPASIAMRALLFHPFGLEYVTGYHLVDLCGHLICVLLSYRLLWRIGRNTWWAFVGAAIVLLLPAHNEAVLLFLFNANVFALLFALLALDLALTARQSDSLWPQIATATSFAVAVLIFEVTIVLPVLIVAADWVLDRRLSRKRLPLYGMLAVVAAAILALRLSLGVFVHVRSDYAISLAPANVALGYLLLLGQMVLLHSSPWPHWPLFSWLREWMSPTNPRVLVSVLLTLGATIAVLWTTRGARERTRREPLALNSSLLWAVWGLLWLLAIGLPFASLSERNPEGRYTYIPSFGMAVALVAVLAWAEKMLRRRTKARWLLSGFTVCLLAFYAYVDTSDVAEWERASAHARAFMQGAPTVQPAISPGVTLAQVGVPGSVGGAFVFTTSESFRSAMRLLYGPQTESMSGDLALRTRLLQTPDATRTTLLLAYDRAAHAIARVERVDFCTDATNCAAFSLAAVGAVPPLWRYVQVYNDNDPDMGGIGLLFDAPNPTQALSCWAFVDLERVTVESAEKRTVPLEQRCAEASADLLANPDFVATR